MPSITEATLEMHFHAALMDLFRETFGLGTNGHVEFFKYSPQLEKFIGFDQAYVRTEMTESELFTDLKNAAVNSNYKLDRVLVGYFLQFKVVKRMVRRSSMMPLGFSTPYYRADLYTQRAVANDPSQHELLYSLAANPGAMVYYACPMIFDRVELYRPKADLDQLALADVATAPGPYQDNERHCVAFQECDSQPIWLSEPHPGKKLNATEFVETLANVVRTSNLRSANRDVVLQFLTGTLERPGPREEKLLEHVSEALTIVSVSMGEATA